MPYTSEKIKIKGTAYDRRQKLTPEQKDEIRHLYYTTDTSQRKLAKLFNVSRRLITFVLNADREERNQKLLKQRKAKGLYKQSKEQRAAIMREHRHYKQQLFLRGKIILDKTTIKKYT